MVDLTKAADSSEAPEKHQEETPVATEEKIESAEKQEAEDAVVEEKEEVDLSELTKAELLKYIEQKGISLKDLGVSKNASAAKIREALEAYLAK